MIQPATILDLADMAEAVTETMGYDCFDYIRNEVYGPNIWYYKNGLALQHQILGDHKVIVHLYGVSRDKLRDIRDFVIMAGANTMDTKGITCFLVFCKETDMALRFLVRATGAKEGISIPQANGTESEIMYVLTEEDRKIYEGRVKCHKQ